MRTRLSNWFANCVSTMKLKIIFAGIVLLALFSCKDKETGTLDSNVIDVEHALQNLTSLKVSDFGKTIRYIPLETTDDGLVGMAPIVKVLKNYIVIEHSSESGSCLLFNKEDGRFIAEIGHYGQDLEAFSSHFSWTDEKEEFLYFGRHPDQLMKFDMKGNFCGKTKFSSPILSGSYYLITDSEIIVYDGRMVQTSPHVLRFFNREGLLKDSIPSFFPQTQVIPNEIAAIAVLRGETSTSYGNWARAGAMFIENKNGTRQVNAIGATRMWKYDEKIRFKEDYVDTIYTVADNALVPSIVFHTGKYHWPIEEKNKKSDKERIFISDVSEDKDFVFFQCIDRMNSITPDRLVLYNGLFDKKTGKTKLSKSSDEIEDDLTHFMPFTPFGKSTAGEFVSLVESWRVMEWLEEHPEVLNNEKLSFLKELDAEMNPILILVE